MSADLWTGLFWWVVGASRMLPYPAATYKRLKLSARFQHPCLLLRDV